MKITLEKIKEMNIPLGTPVEIEKVNNASYLKPFQKIPIPKVLGYYAGLEKLKPEDELRIKLCPQKIDNSAGPFFYENLAEYIPISIIKDIKVWKQRRE